MLSLEVLQKKIKTAQDLLSVVKTMKTLAAVNIRHFETANASLEQYNHIVDLGWQVLLRHRHHLASSRPAPMAICLVVGSDQGMCGQFNEAVLEASRRQKATLGDQGVKTFFWTTGERVRAGLEDEEKIHEHFALPGGISAITEQVHLMVRTLDTWQQEKGIETLYVCHNQLVKGGGYQSVAERLLPLDRDWLKRYQKQPWPGTCLPQAGLPRQEMFRTLFRQYIFVSLYRAVGQSMAGENAARLMSMQAAERNILELEEDLTAKFRETRQNTITAELLDIISGFEAISDRNF